MANDIIEINNIPELSEYLKEVENKENENALSYALNAQLQVIQVIQAPNLCESAFDLLLESLENAVNMTTDNKQKKQIQEKAAIMVNSMIFFMEAKIHYDKDKWSKEGLSLLKQACNMIADSAPAIANIFLTKGKTLFIDGKKIYETFTNDRTFLNRIIDFFAQDQEAVILDMISDFNTFILSALQKLSEYKELFGKSILLAELYDRYKCIIVNSYVTDIKKQKNIKKPEEPKKPVSLKRRINKSSILDPALLNTLFF